MKLVDDLIYLMKHKSPRIRNVLIQRLTTPDQWLDYLSKYNSNNYNFDLAHRRAFMKVYNASSQNQKTILAVALRYAVDFGPSYLEKYMFMTNLYPKLLLTGLNNSPTYPSYYTPGEPTSGPLHLSYGNSNGNLYYTNNGLTLHLKGGKNYKSVLRRFNLALNGHRYKVWIGNHTITSKNTVLRSKYKTPHEVAYSLQPHVKRAHALKIVQSYVPRIKQGIRKRAMLLQLKHMPPVAAFPGGSEYHRALKNYTNYSK